MLENKRAKNMFSDSVNINHATCVCIYFTWVISPPCDGGFISYVYYVHRRAYITLVELHLVSQFSFDSCFVSYCHVSPWVLFIIKLYTCPFADLIFRNIIFRCIFQHIFYQGKLCTLIYHIFKTAIIQFHIFKQSYNI